MLTPGHTEPGGVAQRSGMFARGMARRGWSVRCVTRAATLNRFRITRAPNLVVIEVPGWRRRWVGALLYAVVAAPLALLWGRRAAAFVSVQFAATSAVAGLCARLVRRPLVALSSTSGELSEVGHVLGGRLARLRHGALTSASILVAQTPGGARELERLLPADRIATIPNPVEPVADPPPLTGLPRAVYSGRFSSEKDLPALLRAWRAVAADRDGASLSLVGAGGEYRSVEEELRATIEADEALRRTVHLPGWVPDVGVFLRDADLYVFPSLSEGMSNALLQACAWRRVVVASDIEPNRAILGDDYPLLFPAGDSEALREALARAFDDESLRWQAVEHIDERLPIFHPDAVLARLEETISRAAAQERV